MVTYQTPFQERYTSPEMLNLFSSEEKFKKWRRIWIALAKASKDVGIPISDEQISELETHQNTIDLIKQQEEEQKCRHDVMAQIRCYSALCPKAKPILHLGATSCLVQDNADILVQKQALQYLLHKLSSAMEKLVDFALKEKNTLCLGYTHLQPAQPTTMGKRACLWLQDFGEDLQNLNELKKRLRLRGIKGTTGSQSSFFTLLEGNTEAVKRLDKAFCSYLDETESFPITGQTYPRKQDTYLYHALSTFGASCHKFACDLRLLSGFGELREGFLPGQVGSSAMPYKKNPLYAERICGIARYLMSLSANGEQTHAQQWLERSLDDSSNRRIALADAFFAADSLVSLVHFVVEGMCVDHAIVEKRLEVHKTAFMSEIFMMKAVLNGKDRQEMHELLRTLLTSNTSVTPEQLQNTFEITISDEEARHFLKGTCVEQTEQFCAFVQKQIKRMQDTFCDQTVNVQIHV